MLPLPVTFDLPLPQFTRLPQGTLMAGAMGYIYGKVTDVPAMTSAKLFAIMHLANSILFLLVKARLGLEESHFKGDSNDRNQRFAFACTTMLIQVIGIIAMRHFEMIASKGIAVWSLFALGVCLRQLCQGLGEKRLLELKRVM